MSNINNSILEERTVIINQIKILLNQLLKLDELLIQTESKATKSNVPSMLTIKECVEQFEGLREHTVRWLVRTNKVKTFRPGDGGRGKILINKDSLIEYLESVNDDLGIKY